MNCDQKSTFTAVVVKVQITGLFKLRGSQHIILSSEFIVPPCFDRATLQDPGHIDSGKPDETQQLPQNTVAKKIAAISCPLYHRTCRTVQVSRAGAIRPQLLADHFNRQDDRSMGGVAPLCFCGSVSDEIEAMQVEQEQQGQYRVSLPWIFNCVEYVPGTDDFEAALLEPQL